MQASTYLLTSQSRTKRKINLNFCFSTTFWKCTGREVVSPHTFNMQILLLSCPWALLGSRHWIIFPISSVENVTEDNHLSIRKLRLVGRLLWLAVREHCLQKKNRWRVRSFPWSLLRNEFHNIKELQLVFFIV